MIDTWRTDKGRTVVTVPKTETKDEAIRIANEHFKTKKDNLVVNEGRTRGDMLTIGVKGKVWVISRGEV